MGKRDRYSGRGVNSIGCAVVGPQNCNCLDYPSNLCAFYRYMRVDMLTARSYIIYPINDIKESRRWGKTHNIEQGMIYILDCLH